MVIEKPTSLRDPKKTCYAKIQEFLFCTIYMNTVKREEKNAQFNGRKERWVSIIVADALKIVTIKRTSTKLVRKQVLLTRVWKGIFEIRHSPKIGHRMRDCRECRKPSRLTSSSGQSESTRRALSGVSFQAKHPMEYFVSIRCQKSAHGVRTYQLLLN